jgi:hypothetical protein
MLLLFCFFIYQIESEVWFLEKRPKNWTIGLSALCSKGFSCPVFFREIGQTGHAPRKPFVYKALRFLDKMRFLDMCPVFSQKAKKSRVETRLLLTTTFQLTGCQQ